MIENFKLFRNLILILFVSIFSVSAQTIEKKFEQTNSADENAQIDAGNSFAKKISAPEQINKTVSETSEDTSVEENWKLRRGEKEINLELGYSPFQPTFLSGLKEYDTKGRSFGMVTTRWGRVIGTPKHVTYEFQIEITPIALAFKNEVKNPAFQSAQATPNAPPTVRQTTYGWGFSPVGFRFLFLPNKRLKPFVALHAGFIFFRKPVPQPDTLTYDFTGNFGGGLQYQIRKDKAISFGYKYFHISNMNIGETNPGYNANVFYVGYSFFYK